MSACFSIAELASGITCAALATLRPLAGRVFPMLFSLHDEKTEKYDVNSAHPPTIGSGHSGIKGRRRRSKDGNAWSVDVYDIDLESVVSSPPGTPRKFGATGVGSQERKLSLIDTEPFQMLGSGFGSATYIRSPRPEVRSEGRPTFLDTRDATRSHSITSGIMVEREFEVVSSDASTMKRENSRKHL
jgi:hypothetical protein